jgi:hypothetical protein
MSGTVQWRSFVGCIIFFSLASSPAAGAQYDFDNNAYLGDAKLSPEWADTVARNATEQALIADCLANAKRCARA